MADFENRRAFKRYPVQDGQVYYKKQKKLPLLSRFNGPAPMKDISKSGVCFTVKHTLQHGEIVLMEIVVPGRDKIKLKGEIRWVGADKEVGASFTGLQFLPFGSKKHFNSLESLEKLRELTEYFDNQEAPDDVN